MLGQDREFNGTDIDWVRKNFAAENLLERQLFQKCLGSVQKVRFTKQTAGCCSLSNMKGTKKSDQLQRKFDEKFDTNWDF